jgi:two-component system phosphate regulon response regulator PhoB
MLTADVIIADLPTADPKGIAACRAVHEWAPIARLLVLANDAGEAFRIATFESGADDVLTKPFSMRGLLLRIGALYRRRPRAIDSWTLGALAIDLAARRVTVSGRTVALSRQEFDVLVELIARSGRVQTRAALISRVWGGRAASHRVVDTTVKRLRKKLGATFPIEAVRNIGYRVG